MINISSGQRESEKKKKSKVALQDSVVVCVWECARFCTRIHIGFSLCAVTCVSWCVILPEGSFKNTLCQILDDYCIIWRVRAEGGCGMSHWLHISLVCCIAGPYIGGEATWSPQSIAAALWSFPSGPEWRTAFPSSGPRPNLLQREVMKKLIISNEELVIGPDEMTVSSTLRSLKGLADWEVPNSIH